MSKWNTTSTLSLYLTLICSSAVASFLKYSLEDNITGLSNLPRIVDIGILAALMTVLYYFFAQLLTNCTLKYRKMMTEIQLRMINWAGNNE
jgi:hypothetical protein